jgi:Tol biopolymer transport system component
VPAHVSQTLIQALAKAPADRFGSAAAFRTVLAPRGTLSPAAIVAVERRTKSRWRMVGGAVGGAAVLIVIAVALSRLMAPSPITVTTSSITWVTNETGLEFQPAISPNGEEVAYVAGPRENLRLVVRSTVDGGSGGESRPAEAVGGPHVEPSWTPDGAFLRFSVRTAESEFSWHEVGKYGGSVQTIRRPWPGCYHDVLSPDGTRVVFSRGDSIFGYAADGGEPELLGVHPVESLHPYPFAWSPDGQLIAYVAPGVRIRDLPVQTVRSSSIWIIEADGGEPKRVTGEGFVDMSPAWLDDEHLLFVSDRDGPREVYVVGVAASGPRGAPRKVPGVTDPHTISYSIAGRKLAFSKATMRQNIWSYPVDAGTVSIAVGHPVTGEKAVIEDHDISAGGRWIVYSSNLGGSLDIYKRPVEGGNPTLIAGSPSNEIDPVWSPDGTEIAYHEYVGGESPVMVVSAGGGTPVKVASASWTWVPAWSPSGLALAFNAGQPGQMETWVVSREAIGGPWGEARQVTDFGCEPSDWAPDGSGVLCTVGAGVVPEADTSLVLVSPEGEVLWRYDPSTAGLVVQNIHQRFSRDGSTIYAAATHEDGTEGVWAIPVQGGEPSLVVAYDRAEIVGRRWLSVGPDRLYLTVQQTEIDIWVADVEVER